MRHSTGHDHPSGPSPQGEGRLPRESLKPPHAPFLLCTLLLLLLPAAGLSQPEEVTLLLTSNLEGRFDIEPRQPAGEDPMSILARHMLADRAGRKNVLHFDLGNAFSPGTLSKYSFGEVVMDFFEALSCEGVLVSSQDLQIGVHALESLQEAGRTRLLSSNLFRDGNPLFTPLVVYPFDRTSLAVIGVSSASIPFDIAEKTLANLQVDKTLSVLETSLSLLSSDPKRHVVLLSGQGLRDTMKLLSRFPQIGLAICGGDNRGKLFDETALRVQLADGRWVVQLPPGQGYHRLDLLLGDGLEIRALHSIHPPLPREETAAPLSREGELLYNRWVRKLDLWKERFWEDEATVVTDTGGRRIPVDDRRLALLLQDRFRAEIALVKEHTIQPDTFEGMVRASQVMEVINRDAHCFVYHLTGKEVETVARRLRNTVIRGVEERSVQGYPLEDRRRYRVVSLQPTFEEVEVLLGRAIPFENTWSTVYDLFLEDLQNQQVLFRDDFDFLNRRFRATVDFRLMNFFTNVNVRGGEEVDPPPGRPRTSYRQWGMENEITFSLYNRLHQFILSLHMDYRREDVLYMENMLQGTLLYRLNLNTLVKPYFKSQVETVVEAADGRPVIIRETVGAFIRERYPLFRFHTHLGVGFEQRVHDPFEDPFVGLEVIGNLTVPIWNAMEYSLDVESFLSWQSFDTNREYLRCQITNALSFPIHRYLDISVRYRWFFFRSADFASDYSSTELHTALRLRLDTKFW